MAHNELLLDPHIFYWVLMPIFIVLFLQGVLRQYCSILFSSTPTLQLIELQRVNLLKRSQRLRNNCHYLHPAAFLIRKKYLLSEHGFDALCQDGRDKANENIQQPPDPTAMLGPMKSQMGMIIPNMLMMGWVSFFFSGFVLVKLPFGLTSSFRSMLQRGISLHSLDVSYVSSLSWYFVNLFGIRGLFALCLGDSSAAIDNTEVMARQMQQMGQMPGQQMDPKKLFEPERTELELVQHSYEIPKSEKRLLRRPIQ